MKIFSKSEKASNRKVSTGGKPLNTPILMIYYLTFVNVVNVTTKVIVIITTVISQRFTRSMVYLTNRNRALKTRWRLSWIFRKINIFFFYARKTDRIVTTDS